MKRILFTILLSLSLIFVFFSIGASAAGSEIKDTPEELSDTQELITHAEQADLQMPCEEAEKSVDKQASADTSSEDISKIYELILTHISGIVSVLTLALSVILTNLYKKKLMPTLGGALGNIGDSVKSFGERAEVSLATTEEVARRIGVRIEDMDGVIESFNATLSRMEKRMCELEEHKQHGESIKIMMRTEVEELSRIFSASDLSEINRKTVEEKLTVIKSHLE